MSIHISILKFEILDSTEAIITKYRLQNLNFTERGLVLTYRLTTKCLICHICVKRDIHNFRVPYA